MATSYHVSKTGSDISNGSKETPFNTISKAVQMVLPGDTVIVHEGTYRECVRPIRGGNNELDRITFMAAPDEHVIIKGSERVSNWEHYKENVWTITLPNTFFHTFNPFSEELQGDWLVYPQDWNVHRGDVYLNGTSMYEAKTLEDVIHPQIRDGAILLPLRTNKEYLKNPEDSIYQWHAEVTNEATTIYANFQSLNPNEELTEISVRESCFYPLYSGVDYITVSGFEMAHAATPWAPPTSHQVGLIGPNWSKGWIIENNIIHDAKCSAISLGKDFSTGQNNYTWLGNKPGYQYQWEAMFEGLRRGWCKEKVGSHIVRNNTIYDCGQNAIVGNMGASFSQICHNHIYNIGVKHEFFGFELAGMKFHAPIDTQIFNNTVHDCTVGVWLDWQLQGTRLSHNLFYHNDLDCNLEVAHGPLTIDHNIFGSKYSMNNHAQGIAFIHNMFGGNSRIGKVLNRSTPYHLPHSTQPLGCSLCYSGDEYYYNNLFIGTDHDDLTANDTYGTCAYNNCPDSYDDYMVAVLNRDPNDLDDFASAEQPVFISGNAYYLKAENYKKEKNYLHMESYDPQMRFIEEYGATYLELTLPKEHFNIETKKANSHEFSKTRISNMLFETPDGTAISFDHDFCNQPISITPVAGPFENLEAGYNKIKL